MATPALSFHEVRKVFGETVALEQVSFDVAAGTVTGFLGPNGAGKSTALRVALGLLRPTRGEAFVMGQRAGTPTARRHLAYVPGDVSLWPRLSGAETLDLLASLHGDVDEARRDQLIADFEVDVRLRVRAYSKGNRQKIALIAALSSRADVLVLDEPTSGLDPLMERVFRTSVTEAAARGQSVFLSSHILSEVEHVCDNVVMIRAGRIVQAARMSELRERAGVVFDVIGEVPDLTGVAGVLVVTPTNDGASVSVSGPTGPFLAALSSGRVTSLTTRDVSLEEIFLSYYDEPHAR